MFADLQTEVSYVHNVVQSLLEWPHFPSNKVLDRQK